MHFKTKRLLLVIKPVIGRIITTSINYRTLSFSYVLDHVSNIYIIVYLRIFNLEAAKPIVQMISNSEKYSGGLII